MLWFLPVILTNTVSLLCPDLSALICCVLHTDGRLYGAGIKVLYWVCAWDKESLLLEKRSIGSTAIRILETLLCWWLGCICCFVCLVFREMP